MEPKKLQGTLHILQIFQIMTNSFSHRVARLPRVVGWAGWK